MALIHVRRGPPPALVFLLCLLASVVLMVVDQQSRYLAQVRAALSLAVYPVQWAAALPERVGRTVGGFFTSRADYRAENARLRRELLLLKATQQRYDALLAENARLRSLFVAAAKVADRAAIAELVEVSLEPFTQRILLDKGGRHGVYEGQPVIDADGVLGQVTRVMPATALVTLITDAGHALPVQVQRNGLRAILFGTGYADVLELPHLTATTDIRKGDLLLTSGLGGRFPAGYPAARVVKVVADPNEAFLQVEAEPVARLSHGKQVLLIWPGETAPAPAQAAGPGAAP